MKPTKAITQAAQRLFANSEKPESKEDRADITFISEAGFCPHCACYDGSLQPLAPHEPSERPDEYGGSECMTCEEFVIWGPQCEYEYCTADDSHSDADPGL